uniref:Integrase catalytic domain-containing protein n=1 Tax=Amphimedon queenslandica TaxID=400682 RepID=A0A1X7U0M1_AMPQE
MHVDIVGPLPASKGHTYLLTCIDTFTRWPKAFPLTDITALLVAYSLISGWISRLGVPSTVTTNCRGEFESDLWYQLIILLGTAHIHTIAYHPQANSIMKRFHRQLKVAPKAHNDSSWTNFLPLVLLGIRTALKEDLYCTTAKLVYGMSLLLPSQFFSPSLSSSTPDFNCIIRLKQYIITLHASPTRTQNTCDLFPLNYSICLCRDAVKMPLQKPYNGIYQVLCRSDKYFVLDINGRNDAIGID